MTLSKASAEVWMVVTYSRCSTSSRVRDSRSVMPMTPLIGVRISWLMLATNSDFSREASSASSCARASSSELWMRRRADSTISDTLSNSRSSSEPSTGA